MFGLAFFFIQDKRNCRLTMRQWLSSFTMVSRMLTVWKHVLTNMFSLSRSMSSFYSMWNTWLDILFQYWKKSQLCQDLKLDKYNIRLTTTGHKTLGYYCRSSLSLTAFVGNQQKQHWGAANDMYLIKWSWLSTSIKTAVLSVAGLQHSGACSRNAKKKRHQQWSWRSNCRCPSIWEGLWGHFQTFWRQSFYWERLFTSEKHSRQF